MTHRPVSRAEAAALRNLAAAARRLKRIIERQERSRPKKSKGGTHAK